MHLRFGGLWRHADFRRLWAAGTVSQFGSQITILALPLLAALTLGATPLEMGILVAAEYAPSLLFGLPAGAWIDRRQRRPVMLAADIGRGALLLLVPVLAWSGLLRVHHLYAVAFLVGALTLLFDVADTSFLPTLVRRDDLVEGNGKLEMSRSVAEIAGPGLAGTLVQIATAPVAVLVDAVSFFASAAFLFRIRTPEPVPPPASERQGIRAEIKAGLQLVGRSPVLRTIAGAAILGNLAFSMLAAALILYLARDLGFGPGLIGLVFAGGSIGALVGALLAERASDRFGIGPILVGGQFLSFLGSLGLWFAGGLTVLILPVLIAAEVASGVGGMLVQVNQVSIRQAVTPDDMLGRMNASIRFLAWGTMPLGALLGGALGDAGGLRTVILVAAAIELLAVGWFWTAPLRQVRSLPEPMLEPSPTVGVLRVPSLGGEVVQG